MTEIKTRVRTCDHCGADLTVTGKPYDWHYVLEGEFTPSRSMIGYDPHPAPPAAAHFCDHECLCAYLNIRFDEPELDYAMWDVGGKMIAEHGGMGSIGNYAEQRKFAIALFKAMWKARPSSVAGTERALPAPPGGKP